MSVKQWLAGIDHTNSLIDEIVEIIRKQYIDIMGLVDGTTRFVLRSTRHHLTFYDIPDLERIKEKILEGSDAFCVRCDQWIAEKDSLICKNCS